MASQVSNILALLGKRIPEPGAHMYHAADGVAGGGEVDKEKRHRMRKALYKQRMRASGMTDDIYGSKEVDGRFENHHEAEV